ncbi:MAG TPA: DUF885 family protein [Steroidobacteraceae bacterium]|nr:DUF885 family protein [Steroidobacteraceae bacterium]
MRHWLRMVAVAARVFPLAMLAVSGSAMASGNSYDDLLKLYEEWRRFEPPPPLDGAPDYTVAAIARKSEELARYQARLAAIDPADWPVARKVDYDLVRAQMNGLEFDIRWLRPWARDPAFYRSVWTEQSDTPEHEGPVNHAPVELWQYAFPLSRQDEARLTRELRTVPPLLSQARRNLTGDAHDLWITGTGTMRQQDEALADLASKTRDYGPDLRDAIAAAATATAEFIAWLDAQAPSKTGPSGVGKEAYDWSLRNVHLVPLTWNDQVMLLKSELARAWSSLALEEQRNRGLPQLTPAASAEEHAGRANASITKYLAFLRQRDLIEVDDYLDPALRRRIDPYVPVEQRNFFSIASHYEPVTLYAHFYHWFDHEWLVRKPNPSPIRREAWAYNAWDTRAEGMATAMEEIILHAGYYDDNPRAREIVWIMLAQRCARGLASLYAQANEFDLRQAKAFQVEWTPRGWMRPDLDLLGFEQQLYLRQPGYGTSYVTGKYLIEETIKDRRRQLGEAFTMRRFFDEFNAAGMIPVSLIHWQLTGEPMR